VGKLLKFLARLATAAVALSVLACAPVIVESSPTPATSPGASARTAAPTPTPEATIRKKVGTTVAYLDGWKLTVAGFANVPPQTGTFASTPSPGNRFVKLTVRYDNGTAKEASFNALDWKMQDSAGVRRSTAFAFVQLSDELNSGRLAPGGFVTGSILFELPASEQHAVAIYESFNYLQATWELY